MPRAAVDREGVTFPSTDIAPSDVLFDGHRALSLSPAHGSPGPDGAVQVPWPPALRPFLTGSSRVTVREHLSGTTIFDEEVRFGDSPDRVSITRNGARLTVSKWGRLNQSFADNGNAARRQIKLTRRLLRDLNDKVGVPAYAAYGTLLGAVRAGKVIGHDFDSDISYLSKHSHPADIATESFRVERELRALGWKVERGRTGKLVVRHLRGVDIFVSYFVGDCYHLDQWVEGPMKREHILPLGTVTIEGFDLPAPADPIPLLELNYGSNWATPDPSFKYDQQGTDLARSDGWFIAGYTARNGVWGDYWSTQGDPAGADPSPFARFVAAEADPDALLVDLGCGSGVDTLFFARRGMRAIGYDYVQGALNRAAQAGADLDPAPTFVPLRFADTRTVLARGAQLAARPGPKSVYARFVLDALPRAGHANFWRLVRMATANGGTAYLEFRAEPGPALPGSPNRLWTNVPPLTSVRANIERIGGSIIDQRVVRSGSRTAAGVPVRRVVARWDAG